ncbi:MAG: hypothetical protein E7173_03160 [Firmicutes bacterium]|nr:hypothetical protein [Bacillota bacterium]
MPKTLVIPSSFDMITRVINHVDGFILGIKNLSVNLPFYMDNIEEIIGYIKKHNKEIFVSVNKNIHNDDLEILRDTLIKLDKLGVTGVMYYDASVVNIKRELGLDLDLVWAQEHMTTNYLTSNYWNSFGAKYMFVSNEVTVDEIVEMSQKSNAQLMVQLFGYIPIFSSRRHLITNYLKTFELEESSNYLIEKEGKSYSIVDDNNGTTVYSANILNGFEEYLNLKNNNISYVVLNSYKIEEEKFIKVLEIINDMNESNIESCVYKIDAMFDNVDRGFLYTETVYKVKNNE